MTKALKTMKEKAENMGGTVTLFEITEFTKEHTYKAVFTTKTGRKLKVFLSELRGQDNAIHISFHCEYHAGKDPEEDNCYYYQEGDTRYCCKWYDAQTVKECTALINKYLKK